MTSSAMERALAVPELLALVLDFLEDDTPTLLSAVRVNSLWSRLAAYVLWRDPPCRALLSIPKERRQVYADVIRNLTFADETENIYTYESDPDEADIHEIEARDIETHAQYSELQFPQLRYISVRTYIPRVTRVRIGQYLQPNLREFEIYGGYFHEDLTKLLPERCPRLTRLSLHDIGSSVRVDNFAGFFQHFHALENVSLYFCSYDDDGIAIDFVPDDVLRYLARVKSLKTLCLDGLLRRSAVRRVKETQNKPFPHLRDLSITVKTDALHAIAPMIKDVKKLSLLMSSDMDLEVLWPLKDNLESLHLSYRNWEAMHSVDMTPIKKLTKLRTLQLPELGFAGLSELSHDTLSGVFTCLPLLEIAILSVDMENLIDLLTALGQNCPHLKTIWLQGSCGFQKLSGFAAPLFPVLTSLMVNEFLEEFEIGPQVAEEPRMVASLIRSHMPKLVSLSKTYALSAETGSPFVPYESPFVQDVIECWRSFVKGPNCES